MGAFGAGAVVRLCLVALMAIGSVHAALTPDFYAKSCKNVNAIVKEEVQKVVATDKRMAASLVRLHFHDCFVLGCDGSVLLDNAPGIFSEKFARGNLNSLRGFELIDTIKARLEKACPRTVSCADILAIAYRDSAVLAGLVPDYQVLLGRLDGTFASETLANKFLPGPGLNYNALKENFANVSLDETDLVALSGAHTIGKIRCALVKLFLEDTARIPNINADFLRRECPAGQNLTSLDDKSSETFDSNYYKNLMMGKGVIPSDQHLFATEGFSRGKVIEYARNQKKFFDQFIRSSIKMGNIGIITDRKKGEIRTNCRVVNKKSLIDSLIAYE
ncbi:hypothetical protein KC19_4G042300 [Ceratodon purpureus]|uniref:Peroxidase n=1 Tax=Ceratodon purpureus TaxID=3225 RepID=A0A8T0I5D3_CERPU|nr:hypothetical protein KC19_4G042300 [Ceratodon purpureus]